MLKFIIKILILYFSRYTDIIITVILTEKETKDPKVTKDKVVINTMAPDFNYKNNNGEIVKPDTKVSY